MTDNKTRITLKLNAEELKALDIISKIARKRRPDLVADIIREYVAPFVESMREARKDWGK